MNGGGLVERYKMSLLRSQSAAFPGLEHAKRRPAEASVTEPRALYISLVKAVMKIGCKATYTNATAK